MNHTIPGPPLAALDARAFAALCKRVRPRLERAIRRRVGDPALAEDILQETLLRIHLGRESFHGGGGQPDAALVGWCVGIARHAAIDELRREHRHVRARVEPEACDEVVAPSDDPEAVLLDDEQLRLRRASLQQAVAKLPPGSRTVLELHKFEGRTMKEIAAALRLQPGTVRVRAHRAYLALARLLRLQSAAPSRPALLGTVDDLDVA